SFAEKFNYTDRQTAEKASTTLISSTKLNKARRQRLETSFTTFKSNAADAYWTRRHCTKQTGIIINEAGLDSVKAGHRQSKIFYRDHFQNAEGASSDVDSSVRSGRRPKVSGEDAKNKPSLFERKSMKSPSLKWPAPKLPEKLSKIAPSGKPSPEKHE
ncbi:hypothetical protein BGZ97_009002, partial [Linnemannia gamsii]